MHGHLNVKKKLDKIMQLRQLIKIYFMLNVNNNRKDERKCSLHFDLKQATNL